MKRFALPVIAGLNFLAVLILVGSPVVFAATTATAANPAGQALEIAPPLITLRANPGQVLKTQIKLRDISSNKLLVTNEVDDFVASGDTGNPKILTGNNYNDPFSMKSWVTPLPAFTLSPQQIQTVTAVINVPTDASPGGHYGVIRFTGVPPQLQNTGVSLSASLGALVLLTVNGKLTDNLSVNNFSVNKGGKSEAVFESAPLDFSVLLKNAGNIQEQPTGHITVTDMFGKVVAGVNINIPPRNILPDSSRLFLGKLDSSVLGNKHLFGHYTAVLHVQYGVSTQKTLTASISFWVIPYRLIAFVIVLLIIVFFVLRFLLKRYNRLIVQRAQNSSQPRTTTQPKKARRHKK